MTLKNWIYLFWTTLLVGALSALASGFYLQLTDQEFEFLGVASVGFNMMTMIMGGLMFSIISQMGFFAYLTVNYIALSMIRKKYIWTTLQWIIAVVVLFDLAFLRYLNFEDGKSLLSYAGLPLTLLCLSLLVAIWKVRMTNKSAFIPTLFFMSVATTLEAVPGLQLNSMASTIFMTIPLFLCNAWQILRLHKLVKVRN